MIVRYDDSFVLPNEDVILIDYEVDRLQFFEDLCNQYNKKYKLTYISPDCKIRYHNEDVECLSYPFVVWDISFPEILNPDVKYNFISLNSSPKSFRLLLIADLKKYDYFEYSFFPYPHTQMAMEPGFNFGPDIPEIQKRLKKENIQPRVLTESSGFPLKFESFVEKDLDKSKWYLNNTVPLEYYASNIDIVTESYIKNGIYFTEKTLKALSNKKPFLVLGDQHINKALKHLGFEIFEELFDYEFDNQSDFLIRYKKMMEQILRYINEDPKKIQQIIKGLGSPRNIKDKLDHNYELLKKIQRERETLFVDLWGSEEERTISDNELLDILRSKQNEYTIK